VPGWAWDPSLYLGSAAYYARGRVAYPADLAARIAAALDLDGSGRLLDVGCGPGSLTLLLAPLFEDAIGIDADADMISAAREAAAGVGAANVTWRWLRAEELPADLGGFRLITFAQSFHWFERDRVAGVARAMLNTGGACVHVHATTDHGVENAGSGPHPRPPWPAIHALTRGYLGPVQRAGQSRLPAGTPTGEDQIYQGAGFIGPDRIEIPGRWITRSVPEVVAAVFSLSRSAPHLFGSRQAAFEAELGELLRQASPAGVFSEFMREIAIDIWR
jgi:SAM-dependent methyltransferase